MYHPHFNTTQARNIVHALAHEACRNPYMAEVCRSTLAAFDSPILTQLYEERLQLWGKLGAVNKIEWTCAICGKLRPDQFISVFKRDISEKFVLPAGTVGENVRYCNDSEACFEGAQVFHHIKLHA